MDPYLSAIQPGDLPRFIGCHRDARDLAPFGIVDGHGVGIALNDRASADQRVALIAKVEKIGCAARDMARGGNHNRSVGGRGQAQNATFVRREGKRDASLPDPAVFLLKDVIDVEFIADQAEILVEGERKRSLLIVEIEETNG